MIPVRLKRRPRSYTNKNHVCVQCGNCYAFLKSLRRHLRYECGLAPRFRCPYCNSTGKQRAHVKEHIRRKHNGRKLYVSEFLQASISSNPGYRRIRLSREPQPPPPPVIENVYQRLPRNVNSSPGRFPCDRCGKVYRWYRNLTTHLRLECGKEPSVVCPYCPRRTKHRNSMRSHIQPPLFPIVRPRLHVCPRCGQMYSWASNLRKHLKTGCGTVTCESHFSCQYCPYRSRVEASFLRHLMSVHNINSSRMNDDSTHEAYDDLGLSCDRCMKMFYSQYSLTKHLRFCSTLKQYSCFLCEYRSNRKWNVKSHIERVHGKTPAKNKAEKLETPEFNTFMTAMRRPMRGFMHQPQQRVTYPCRNCGKHYNYHSSLARHLKHECGVEPKFQCPLCPYRTKHRSSLNTHLNGKHLKRRSGDTGFEILADRKFPSDDSTEKIETVELPSVPLPGHRRIYGQGHYVCPKCKRRYYNLSTLNRHAKNKCGLIGLRSLKEFYRISKRWSSNSTSSLKPVSDFKCENCNRTFAVHRNLTRHQKLDCTAIKKFSCTTCPAKYSQNIALRRHFTLPPEVWKRCKVNLVCLKCCKSYSDWRSLKKHMNYFCQVEPLYPCPYCSYRARMNTLLKYHINREHYTYYYNEQVVVKHSYEPTDPLSIRPILLSSNQLRADNVIVRIAAGVYGCSICDYRSSYKTNVDRHVRNVHSCNETPRFKCKLCDFRSKYKSCVDRHLRSFHKGA
ncbi:hypothetical protein TSAR_003218, partial [Trichomalopsis sarcophagae]